MAQKKGIFGNLEEEHATMATWLKFYSKERYQFPTASNIHYCDEQSLLVANKLFRHFLPKEMREHRSFSVRFYGSNGAMAYLTFTAIRLPHKPSLLEVCHEVAHIVNYIKYHDSRHSKKLMRTIGKMVAYSKKKEYWLQQKSQCRLFGGYSSFMELVKEGKLEEIRHGSTYLYQVKK